MNEGLPKDLYDFPDARQSIKAHLERFGELGGGHWLPFEITGQEVVTAMAKLDIAIRGWHNPNMTRREAIESVCLEVMVFALTETRVAEVFLPSLTEPQKELFLTHWFSKEKKDTFLTLNAGDKKPNKQEKIGKATQNLLKKLWP